MDQYLGKTKNLLFAQTSSAFKQTLSYPSLIEDLLNGGYKFVMTARFESDPIEKRFGQYRQMSGGRFLVSLKDALCSERIIKLKSLVKEGIDICNSDVKKTDDQKIIKLQYSSLNNVSLSEDIREVAFHIAGYIEKKVSKRFGKCCHQLMIGVDKQLKFYQGEDRPYHLPIWVIMFVMLLQF